MEKLKTSNEFGEGVVHNYASILEHETQRQAEAISRSPIIQDFVGLMPDAHFGMGACVGSAIMTTGGIIPAAVGVDIGCGVIAVQTDLNEADLSDRVRRAILGTIRDTVPASVGVGHDKNNPKGWRKFYAEFDSPPSRNERAMGRMAKQFGTLGSGNHFAEVCRDENGGIWTMVHSGSRGPGNLLAQQHIKAAQDYVAANNLPVEHRDLAYLESGTPEFEAYIADLNWAQAYAFHQRAEMSLRVSEALEMHAPTGMDIMQTVNCHHNYTQVAGIGKYLSRKGAINAEVGQMGVIPGSMGAASYIVVGKGDPDSHMTSPHGAGRNLSRGRARRELDIDVFKAQMHDRVWQDRDAENLMDEAPDAYKDIDIVMADSESLVTPLFKLEAIINFKGV